MADWHPRPDHRTQYLAPEPAQALAATLDLDTSPPEAGDALPPLWQWLYFTPRPQARHTGEDGHPARGDFLPPIDLPRRMFAGGRLRILRPLRLGQPATRVGEVLAVTPKDGRNGRLVFVRVGYRYLQDGQPCLEEEQDIVYRPASPSGATAPLTPAGALPPPPAGAWTRTVTPDPVLLFRFSALTFNSHRIHYDRPYAQDQEGYPDLVVHGPLIAILLADLLRRHTTQPLRDFRFRAVAPLFAPHPFRLIARPDALGADQPVPLTAEGPDGTIAMQAEAVLQS